MKNFAFILVVAMFAFLFNDANSQSLPSRALFRLKSYETPQENKTFENSEKSSIVWTVYSDRDNNKSYTQPGSGVTKCMLNFMDAFNVLEERDGYLWLIKPEFVDADGYVTSDAVDCGWIKKNKMLLWTNCLKTKECNLDRKGMILNTIDAFKERIEDVKLAKFYYDPQLNIASDLKSNVYKIYFVYKSSPNSLLLGRKSNFSLSDSKGTIVGWVRKSRITPWDHRLAIEPNWNKEAVSEREKKEIKLRFFDSEEVASQYESSGIFPVNKCAWEENPYYRERKIGQYPRFPVLFDDGSDLVKVGIIDKMTSKYGEMNLDTASVIANHISYWRDATKNINIVFVIDGSSSMQPYFKPVAKAVKNSMNELLNRTNNEFRFAAVVYRDFKEGERKIEKSSLSGFKKTANFLDCIIAKNIFDKDIPEAVNYGLKEAILGVGLPKNETNVIVLIGDAGNHHRNDETQVSSSEIINLLDEYECNLLVFQVANHSSHPSYNEFIDQTKEMILKLANLKYNRIINVSKVVNANFKAPEFLPQNQGVYELNKTAIVASLVSCELNKSMPPDQIGIQVENVIDRINMFVNDLKNEVQNVVVDGYEFNTKTSLGPAFLYALKKAGLSDDEIKFYCALNSQMYYEGYGSVVNSKVNNPLAKYTLFMDKKELSELLKIFDNLLNATSYNDKRKMMKKAWIEILRKHIGNSEEIDIESLKLGELSSKIMCLPKASNMLSIPLIQITDPKKFSDIDFNKYLNDISKKRNKLRKINKNKDYKYSFSSDDKTYYWIDIDLLP